MFTVAADHLPRGFALAAMAGGVASPQERSLARVDSLDDPFGKQDGAHCIDRPRTEDDIGRDGAGVGGENHATPARDVAVDGLNQWLQVCRPNLAGCQGQA
jgi:hypothetical protein